MFHRLQVLCYKQLLNFLPTVDKQEVVKTVKKTPSDPERVYVVS